MAANTPTENAEQTTVPAAGPNGTQPTGEVTAAADPSAPAPSAHEARLPTRKDASLKEFLNKMDDYAPIVRHPQKLARHQNEVMLTQPSVNENRSPTPSPITT